MNVSEILRISRPRFWIYEAATFAVIGAVSAFQGLSFFIDWRYWIFALYFLIPANILIYGINDIYDYETDRLNPKKGEGAYESLVSPHKRRFVWRWIMFTNIPFLIFIPNNIPAIMAFIVFIFCASFYSAPPIRAKARPVIDSLFSAGHYVATGVFGYYLAGGVGFPSTAIFAGMLWSVAMHAYSAVPDIQADAVAKLKTIAILVGKHNTVYLCWFLYVAAAFLVRDTIPVAAGVGAIVFSWVMYVSIRAKTEHQLFLIYARFPIINTLVGAVVSIELLARNIL